MDYKIPGAYEVIAVGDTPIGLTAANIAGAGRDTSIHMCVENYNIRGG